MNWSLFLWWLILDVFTVWWPLFLIWALICAGVVVLEKLWKRR